MAKKPVKNYEGGLWSEGIFRAYQARLKTDAEQCTGNMTIRLALPIAHFVTMGARADIPSDERAKFNQASQDARESWEGLLQQLDNISDEHLRHRIAVTVDRLCAGVAEMSRYMPPADIRRRQVMNDGHNTHARMMRDARKPDIERRKDILRSGKFCLEEISDSRKIADAVAIEFEAMCKKEGLESVSGKTLQRYARDILEERREKPGHT